MKLGRLLVCAYLVLMPWSVLATDGISGHDYARVVQLFLMLACAICIAVARPDTLRWPSSAVARWIVGLMALFSLLSVTMADRPDWAAREVLLVLGLISIAVVMASASDLLALQRDLQAVVLAGAFYGALLLCITALSLIDRQPLLWRAMSLGYDHPRFLNHVQTVALPLLALSTRWFPPKSIWRGAAWFGLVVGFALLWFTGGRATLLGLVVAAAACLVLLRRQGYAFVARLALGMGLGFLLYLTVFVATPFLLGMPVPFELANRAQDSGSVYSRLLLWEQAIDLAKASPLWGAGPMHFAHHQNIDAAHPHNIYLQLAGEWGLPIALLVLIAAWGGLRNLAGRTRTSSDEKQSLIGMGLFVSGVAVACDGFLSGSFVMPVSQVWIAALIGWGTAWARLRCQPENRPASKLMAAGSIMSTLLLASQAILVLTSAAEFKNMSTHLEQAFRQFPSETSNPRLWSHGWF